MFEAVQSTWAGFFSIGSLRGDTDPIISVYFTIFSFTDISHKSCIVIAHETTLSIVDGLWHSVVISALVPTPSLRKRLQYEYIWLLNFANA